MPSRFNTSTARTGRFALGRVAVGLTLKSAVISPEFATTTLTTDTSVARVCPLESLTAASGGEITTVAPGRKFAPTNVIRMWSAPCPVNWGETLIRLGEGALLTVSATALEVSPPPAAKGLKTVIDSVAGVAMSDAKIVAVSCSELLNVVGRLLPYDLHHGICYETAARHRHRERRATRCNRGWTNAGYHGSILRAPGLAHPHHNHQQSKRKSSCCASRLAIHGAPCCYEPLLRTTDRKIACRGSGLGSP